MPQAQASARYRLHVSEWLGVLAMLLALGDCIVHALYPVSHMPFSDFLLKPYVQAWMYGALALSVALSLLLYQQSRRTFLRLAIIKESALSTSEARLRSLFEATPDALLISIQDTVGKMHALKAKGVCFALDDFGTGYSSLSYLSRLPLDQLKIDQSFVSDVLTDPNDAAIARTVIALGQSMQLAVIAEGVETQGQRDFLQSCGCHTFQGYFFSRPLPLQDFEAFVRKCC
jgi:EAL domain-containing protein (putative c-di-GMP-specific phosphodiesterase class I)